MIDVLRRCFALHIQHTTTKAIKAGTTATMPIIIPMSELCAAVLDPRGTGVALLESRLVAGFGVCVVVVGIGVVTVDDVTVAVVVVDDMTVAVVAVDDMTVAVGGMGVVAVDDMTVAVGGTGVVVADVADVGVGVVVAIGVTVDTVAGLVAFLVYK